MLRGTFGGAPPEFIQTILQAVAGQMMGGAAPTNPTATNVPAPPETVATPTTETSQESSNQTSTTTAAGTNVNSQARVTTQTHPTTSTQTRSTPRPHVHLAQHTMQGFDPFLPCNSHHIRRRRHANNASQVNTTVTGPNLEAEVQNNNQPTNTLYNILQGFLRTVGNHVGRMQRGERPAQQEAASANSTPASNATSAASTDAPSSQATPDPLPPFSTFLGQNPVSNE